jgi:phosphoenolpyruvate carboxykinase (ATP)
MSNSLSTDSLIDLGYLNLHPTHNLCNASPEELAEISVQSYGCEVADNGALVVMTGRFTGRSPKDRFIVHDDVTRETVDWNAINQPIDQKYFNGLKQKMIAYLSAKNIYTRDAFAGADKDYRLAVRVITEYPWSNMFAYNMFLRPTDAELSAFSPEWHVICAPGFEADPAVDGTKDSNFSIINFADKTILVGGSAYTGEIKKGIFSVLNYTLPEYDKVLAMHCSANMGDGGDTALFFGLSGTGKTTLSADPDRALIGDDEHGWTASGVFNFEGGCYAKVIDLSKEKEPDIFNAIKPGAILENIVFKDDNKAVDYADGSITQNTRVSYPIDHINNIAEPSMGGIPKNIFFLTYDAFGVLPPISRLSVPQAMYHFISGFTSKVAGTEAGVTEPQTAFSACYGAPFLPLHPFKYSKMLGEKIEESGARVWLVNTGLSGGVYGVGKRMSLPYTRSLISQALDGSLDSGEFMIDEFFDMEIPMAAGEVPANILNPINTWTSKEEYAMTANRLIKAFESNFEQFQAACSDEICAAAPRVK